MKQSEVKKLMKIGALHVRTFAMLDMRPMSTREFNSTRLVATNGTKEVSAKAPFDLLKAIDMAHEGWQVRYETLGLSATVELASIWHVVYKAGQVISDEIEREEFPRMLPVQNTEE